MQVDDCVLLLILVYVAGLLVTFQTIPELNTGLMVLNSTAESVGNQADYKMANAVKKLYNMLNNSHNASISPLIPYGMLQLSCFLSQEVKYVQTGIREKMKEEIEKASTVLSRNAKWQKNFTLNTFDRFLYVSIIFLSLISIHVIKYESLINKLFTTADMYGDSGGTKVGSGWWDTAREKSWWHPLARKIVTSGPREKLQEKQISFRFFGDVSLLSPELRKLIAQIQLTTKDYTDGVVNVCMPYTSRDEISRSFEWIRKGREKVCFFFRFSYLWKQLSIFSVLF
uniref:Ditrans,polycis-polyprenyl diphosphate synthase [(2E,6E)-farnesyldiphosphate specific] n=1 Tax=Heterorhabditis bacteriophora TaxID=37862 RepID=A0A1I7WPN7_HETBA